MAVSSTLRPRVLLLLLVAGALAVVSGVSAARAQTTSVQVSFLEGEQMEALSRPGSTGADAIRQLLAGPTAAEVERGVRTYVPKGLVGRPPHGLP